MIRPQCLMGVSIGASSTSAFFSASLLPTQMPPSHIAEGFEPRAVSSLTGIRMFHAVMFFLICRIAFFSRRDTWAWEMPTCRATSIWVRPS